MKKTPQDITENPQTTGGGEDKLWVNDTNSQELLREILNELKRMNVHLQIITDENINEGDL